MTLVIAVHEVRRNPRGIMRATGRFDPDGQAIMRSKPDIHEPGSSFDIEDAVELAGLLATGAVQLPDKLDGLLDHLGTEPPQHQSQGSDADT